VVVISYVVRVDVLLWCMEGLVVTFCGCDFFKSCFGRGEAREKKIGGGKKTSIASIRFASKKFD